MTFKIIVIVGVVCLCIIGYLILQSYYEPEYSLVQNTPISLDKNPLQNDKVQADLPPMQKGKIKYFFTPRASYKISGLLVSKRNYFRGPTGYLSPYDYALVWGSVPQYLPYLKFSQTYRYCLFTYKYSASVDINYVQLHFSNNHIIPANSNIRKALKYAKKHSLVEIEGYLVNVMINIKGKGTSNWNTSTRRDDKGDGACEIIYVTRLRLGDRVYE